MRYNQIRPIDESLLEPTLDEVAMNPTAYADAITRGHAEGVRVGFEFEVCVPHSAIRKANRIASNLNLPSVFTTGYEADWDEEEMPDTDAGYWGAALSIYTNFSPVLSQPIVVFDSYHQRPKSLNKWYIEPDGSLEAGSGDGACEFVSPPLPASDAIEAMNRFYEVAQSEGYYTGKQNNTGLHINVSIPRNLDVLKLAVFLGEDYVLRTFGRETNHYISRVLQKLQRNKPDYRSAPRELGAKPEADTEHMISRIEQLARQASGGHMSSISFNGDYVSFRHAGGDYLSQYGEIMKTVGRFVRCMLIASDETAFRQEYMKKLSQFMQTKPALKVDTNMAMKTHGIPIINISGWLTSDMSVGSLQDIQNQFSSDWNIPVTASPGTEKTRAKMISGTGFKRETKDAIRASDISRFFELTVFANQSRDKFHNTTMNKAYSLKTHGGAKFAIWLAEKSTIMPNDPGFMRLYYQLRKQ